MTNDYFYSLYKTRYLRHSKKTKRGGSILLLYKLIFIVRSLVRFDNGKEHSDFMGFL